MAQHGSSGTGERGTGTVPGHTIGADGGTGAHLGAVPKTAPRSEDVGTTNDDAASRAAGEAVPEAGPDATTHEPSVTEEAPWGVTSGAPSGGTSGGVGADEVMERARRAA